MFHKLLTTAILITATFTLLPAQIWSIDAYTNEQQYMDFDSYGRTIARYEDRLIVQNTYKIEEYQMLANGELERISFQETKQNLRAYLDGSRFYSLSRRDNNFGEPVYHIEVFDVATSPITRLTAFEVTERPGYHNFGRIYFTDFHILVHDGRFEQYFLIDKQTYEPAGVYTPPDLKPIIFKSETLIVKIDAYTLYFYQTLNNNNLEGTLMAQLPLTFHYSYLTDIVEQSGHLVLSHSIPREGGGAVGGVTVIDIGDVSNPTISYNIINSEYDRVKTATYLGSSIVVQANMGQLDVYDLYANGEYAFSARLYGRALDSDMRNMYFDEPYLYVNQTSSLTVYDVTDFSQVAQYGTFRYSYGLTAYKNDLYLSERWEEHNGNNDINSFTLYSVFDDELLFGVELINQRFYSAVIEYDKYYVIRCDISTNSYFLEVYDINNQQLELLSSLPVGEMYRYAQLLLFDNLLYLQFVDYINYVEVYEITNYQPHYIGSFSGKMQDHRSDFSNDYIININENNVLIRDIRDYTNILATYTISWSFASAWYVNSEVFLLGNDLTEYLRAYRFNIQEQTVSQIYQFPHWPMIEVRNDIIANSNCEEGTTSTYYSVVNGEIHQIGQRNDERAIWWTYFFTRRGKMVQDSMSGIWIYDLEFTLDEADKVAEPSKTGLVSNYPNPFNPSTTISFSIENDGMVGLDIYNVKGQKVRALGGDVYNRGQHKVVWDGRDDSGTAVSSGVYFYRLTAGGEVSVKKMVMVK